MLLIGLVIAIPILGQIFTIVLVVEMPEMVPKIRTGS
jgi:hypothetical protein